MKNMKHDKKVVEEVLDEIQDVVDPIVEEVEGQEEVEKLKAQTDHVDDEEVRT